VFQARYHGHDVQDVLWVVLN